MQPILYYDLRIIIIAISSIALPQNLRKTFYKNLKYHARVTALVHPIISWWRIGALQITASLLVFQFIFLECAFGRPNWLSVHTQARRPMPNGLGLKNKDKWEGWRKQRGYRDASVLIICPSVGSEPTFLSCFLSKLQACQSMTR